MTVTAFVFPKLRTPKTWLGKCLESDVSEDPSSYSSITAKEIELEKFYLIDMPNLGTAC